MVQDQLTDYISSQMKLGVSRDAIKSALVSAGWVAGDVEDTLKKAEGGAPTQQPMGTISSSKPATTVTSGSSNSGSASPFFSATSSGASASAVKSSDPQMIRVSDLVSTSPAAKTTSKVDVASFGGKIKGNTFEASPAGAGMISSSPKTSSTLIMEIVGGVLILLLAGLSWYFYSQNAGLSAKATTLSNQSSQVSSQLATLQAQMNASSTGIAAQLGSLTAANADLALDLSFYAVPLGASNATSSLPVTISGSLGGGGKTPYSIITPRGAKIYVANSSNAQIAGQLKPLLGQTVELTGTYIQGSDEITINSVSDLSGPVIMPTPTSTATTATSTP